MTTNAERRYVNVGYRLTAQGHITADPKELQIEYSIDPWRKAPEGFVWFVDGADGDREYWVPAEDLAPWRKAADDHA